MADQLAPPITTNEEATKAFAIAAIQGTDTVGTTDVPSQFLNKKILDYVDAEFMFAQTAVELIPASWILLDSQSTVSVFKNRRLLSNIRPSTRPLRVHTNGGTQISTLIGSVTNFGDVWYNAHSLANILSMAEVRKVCRITMDTSVEAAMHVHRQDGTIMTFKEYTSGLYLSLKPI